jgi:probable O-glycosylation ligase (exosortase A-associated)
MKQTLLMVALTLMGTVGVFVVEPFWGVAIYYLFAVLRPQSMWEWSLPPDIRWSNYVAICSMLGSIGLALGMLPFGRDAGTFVGFKRAHKVMFLFACWICLTYVTAYNRDASWFYIVEYSKLFVMYFVATIVVRNLRQIWILYLLTALSLGYIAYEINFLYLVNGRLDIYHHGYGGVDNNGAGLMLAVGVPLCVYAWQATNKMYRWLYLGFVPFLLHAIMLSYSRGAMVGIIVGVPLIVMRATRRRQFAAAILLLALVLPSMAGEEVRNEFFSASDYQEDGSAQSRFGSWTAAIRMANEHPFLGMGLRNSPLYSHLYGADMEGRVIHSQFFQILADCGYPGLGLYLLVLATSWLALRRVRKAMKGRTDSEALLIKSMASGIECGLFVFCASATFLSVELFELPYVLLLLSAQLGALVQLSAQTVTQPAAARPAPAPPQGHFGVRPAASPASATGRAPFAPPPPGWSGSGRR